MVIGAVLATLGTLWAVYSVAWLNLKKSVAEVELMGSGTRVETIGHEVLV